MKILLTGGSSGLGNEITCNLARNKNYQVFFTYYQSKDEAKKTEREFSNTSKIFLDFNSLDSINKLIEIIPDLEIDVLINNAYDSFITSHFRKIKDHLFHQSFKVNVEPTLLITKASINYFKKKKFGKIINILTAYLVSNPPVGLSEYVANKAYLLSMSKSWATEYSRNNITSNAISPSFLRTRFTKNTDERVVDQMIKSHP